MIIGIDASNLRYGGGRTHLIEVLRVVEPVLHGFTRIVVWGSRDTLAEVDDRPWITKLSSELLNGGLLKRLFWQKYYLSDLARKMQCDILFVPGGNYTGNFHPVVTMSRNLLPFDKEEMNRYRFSVAYIRLLLLRTSQARTFREAEGVIFLTDYAMRAVQSVTRSFSGKSTIIPHGVSNDFCLGPKTQKPMSEYTFENPLVLLYVSIIEEYKHQWNCVDAVKHLRKLGYPVVLRLVGPAYPPSLSKLESSLEENDPEGVFVEYLGSIKYEELSRQYASADVAIFASSCENMPNILVEKMAVGLPIACSDRGPMREILRDAGLYFDPEDIDSIVEAMKCLLDSSDLRAKLAARGFEYSNNYSWQRCADETFGFLTEIARAEEQS